MSRGINKWIGIGNACADPEVKYTAGGQAITNVTVACNDSYKDKNTGQIVDKTEFVRVVFFNRLAEIAGEYLRKGSKVYIEGKLQTQKWQDKDGNDRFTTQIIANEMQMLDSRGDGDQQGQQQGRPASQYAPQQQIQKAPVPQQPPQGPLQGMDEFIDDIPF